MTKEEIKQEAEELIQRFEMANSMNCYMSLTPDRKQIGEMLVMIAEPREKRIAELEAQIEKMKKYGKLLQDICGVMGNDPYMVWRGLEQRVLILWDKSEEEKGLKMAENILDRLLKIKPQDWAEIEKWEKVE